MRHSFTIFFALMVLSFSLCAWAAPSDRMLHALEGEIIRVSTNTDNTYQGELYAFDDDVVILLDDVANLKEIQRSSIVNVKLAGATAKTSSATTSKDAPQSSKSAAGGDDQSVLQHQPTSQTQARTDFLYEHRQLERIGSAYRISGGVIAGVGALTAFSSLMSLAIGGTHWSTDRNRDTLNKGAVISAIVGTAIAGAGTGLIIAGNTKRRRAKAAYKKSFDYALTPAIRLDGGGAQFTLQF